MGTALRDTTIGPWAALGEALRRGLPVPTGFVVEPADPEQATRAAYEELKRLERTHFVAVRGPSHALLDVLGNDAVIHALRRLWSEAPDAAILIQRMVNAQWCGKAVRNQKNRLIRIQANQGMMVLDPDSYVFNMVSGKCTRRVMQKSQRRVIRSVDGRPQTLQSRERGGLTTDQLKDIVALTESAQADITWALDDRQFWLLSVTRP
jgi:hypothetical protein